MIGRKFWSVDTQLLLISMEVTPSFVMQECGDECAVGEGSASCSASVCSVVKVKLPGGFIDRRHGCRCVVMLPAVGQ